MAVRSSAAREIHSTPIYRMFISNVSHLTGVYFAVKATDEAMPKPDLFELLMNLEELELLPFHKIPTLRSLKSYRPRWRELLLYVQVAYLRFVRRIPFQAIEQQML